MRNILALLLAVALALSISIPVVSAQAQPVEVATIPPKSSVAVKLWVDSDTSLRQPLSSWGSWSGSWQPDLTLSTGDIGFNPSAPAEGDTITIKATIHNDGIISATNVVVQFSTDGTPIGEQTIIWIQSGSTGTASIKWVPAAAGTHTITVKVDPENRIAESNEGNNLASREITVAGGTPATIGYSPSSFSFAGTQGGADPSSRTLSIWNSGGSTLSWSVSDDAACWLSLSPTSGSSTGETDNVIASVDISGMSAGSYSATITISAPGATNTPQTVSVSLTIAEAPATIGYSPSSLSFAGTQGGANPSSQTLSIWDSGSGTISWSVSDDAAWLSLSPTSGSSTGETDNVIASVDISGMGAGSYSATITISAPGATNTPQTVSVSLTINSAAPTDDNKWAVIIGIADYAGTRNDLYHPDDDAREMYTALTEIYGFPESHITMLIDSEATLANIKAAIAWLAQNEDSESTVVFFFCGHGYQVREWDLQWRNADGDREADGKDEFIVSYDLYAYADGYLRNDFAKFESHKIMLWFGSCYSGGMNDIAAPGRVIVSACGENQYGYDISLDTPVAGIPWAGNTLFGYYYVDEGMLQGLADGTLTADGTVTVEEAFWYAKLSVEAWAASAGIVSGPVIFDNYPGEFYL
jgi:hypothetical protein